MAMKLYSLRTGSCSLDHLYCRKHIYTNLLKKVSNLRDRRGKGSNKASSSKARKAAKSETDGKEKDKLVAFKTRESDSRKQELKYKIDIKRLTTTIEKLEKELDGSLLIKPHPVDPQYQLKGAARIALQVYAPQLLEGPKSAPNFFESHKGQLWSLPKGQEYLKVQWEYALKLQYLLHKTKDCIAVLTNMLDYDQEDHLSVQHQITMIFIERKQYQRALDYFLAHSSPSSVSVVVGSCFNVYTEIFLQTQLPPSHKHIKSMDALLSAAYVNCNSFLFWFLAYPNIFRQYFPAQSPVQRCTALHNEDKVETDVHFYYFAKGEEILAVFTAASDSSEKEKLKKVYQLVDAVDYFIYYGSYWEESNTEDEEEQEDEETEEEEPNGAFSIQSKLLQDTLTTMEAEPPSLAIEMSMEDEWLNKVMQSYQEGVKQLEIFLTGDSS